MTTVSAAKTALKALLVAALPSSQVIYGPASSVTTLGSRVVEVGGPETQVRYETDFNGNPTLRTYVLPVTISVSQPGTDISTVEDLAEADAETAVTTIANNRSLGLSNLRAKVDGNYVLMLKADETGRSAAVRFDVTIVATV